jgi:hypothetical protein
LSKWKLAGIVTVCIIAIVVAIVIAICPRCGDNLPLEIVSVTSQVSPGAYATLKASAPPGAQCSIAVYYKSGRSTAQGLYPKQADSNGDVSWTWKVGTRTTPGSWLIVVTATYEGKTTSQETYFTVK